MIQVFIHGVVDIKYENSGAQFKVNGQRLKHYYGGDVTRVTSLIMLSSEQKRLRQAKDFTQALYGR